MIFSDYIDQEGLVGGGAHDERNTQQNPTRIDRVGQLTFGSNKEDVYILDWGAGFGRLVNDLRDAGYSNTYGYDPFTEEFGKLPTDKLFDLIISVECVEHMATPYAEFDAMFRLMKPGAGLMLETGFLNAAWEDGVSDSDNPYINSDAGHCSIFTHHSMDVLALKKGFIPLQSINRHVKIFQKPFRK
jgi:SAM-dependent methyltransferase